MKKVILFFWALCVVWSCNNISIVTGDASLITSDSSVLSGVAKHAGKNSSSIEVGVFVSNTERNLPDSAYSYQAIDILSDDSFSVSVENLEGGTTYYYCAYVYQKGKYKTGEIKSFRTQVAPAQTGEATGITSNSATLSGRVVVEGEKTRTTEGGVLISLTEGIFPSTTPNFEATSFDRDNNFTITIDELKEGTTYYYCTYLYHKGKYKIGKIKSFTTKITPEAKIDRIVYSKYIKKGAQRTIGIITDSDCEISVDSVDPDIASGIVQDNNKLVVSGHSEGLANFVIHFPETEAYMGHEDINLLLCVYNGEILADLGVECLWAKCNLGATKPEEYGDFYAWGELAPKDDYTRESYNKSLLDKYYCAGAWATYGKQQLDAKDDVAHVKLGDYWCIPHQANWERLKLYCDWSWTTINGIQGYKITSKNPEISDDWIFLPAAGKKIGLYDRHSSQPPKEKELYGEYWAGNMSSHTQGGSYAYIMSFKSSSDFISTYSEDYRCNGHSIRPVYYPDGGYLREGL